MAASMNVTADDVMPAPSDKQEEHILSRETSADSTRSGGRHRSFSWNREQSDSAAVQQRLQQLEADPADGPVVESEPEVPKSDMAYSRNYMLLVRLAMQEAQVDEKALSICMKSNQPAAPALEATVESCENPTSQLTTVMLRNLPKQCTRDMVVTWLCTTEFNMEFDLVHVPTDRTSGDTLGYCFINLMEAATCQRFMSVVRGMKVAKCFPGCHSGRRLRVCYAKGHTKVQCTGRYWQGLANGSRLSATGCDESERDESPLAMSAALTTELAREPTGSSAKSKGLRASASVFVPKMSASCQVGITESAASSSASLSKGLRTDAPDFVPQDKGRLPLNTDEFLETLTGKWDKVQSHKQAAARAKHFAAQLGRWVKSTGGIFVPAKQGAPEAAAEASEELW